MKLSYLLDTDFPQNLTDTEIENITCSISESNENSLLFLVNVRAEQEFTNNAVNAAAIIYEGNIQEKANIIKIKVKNVRRSLSVAYKKFYCDNLSDVKFIGVTGTNGKSTTSLILKTILEGENLQVGLFGTGTIYMGGVNIAPKNYSMTTPTPDILYPYIAKMQKAGIKVIIMEISSHALVQERVSPIEFELCVFTNMSREHLDYHKTMSEYFNAKKRLFYKTKFSIVNSDDEYGSILASEFCNTDTVGTKSYNTVQIKDISDLGFEGENFTYLTEKNKEKIFLQFPGIYNVYNTALAIRAAEKLGVSVREAKKFVESIKSIDGRYNVIKDRITVIIDYAHTEFAFKSFLKSLFLSKKPEQNIILVFGCGGERDKYKRYFMGAYAENFANKTILTSDNPRGENPIKIIRDIASCMHRPPTIIPQRDEAIKYAINEANVGDIVAIVGKGPEKYLIENGKYIDFNEEQIVYAALKAKKYDIS